MKNIVVGSNIVQKKILEKFDTSDSLVSIKFITKKELTKGLCFSYDTRAVYYLVKKYNLIVENAIMYLDNILYVEDKLYNNQSLDYLVSLKKELTYEGLLTEDKLFKTLVSNSEISFYDQMELQYDKEIIKKLKTYGASIKIIKDSNIKYKHPVYSFNSVTEEVEYVISYICNLYLKGTSLSKIKLINLSDEHKDEFKRISSLYDLPINFNMKNKLYGLAITNEFLDKLKILPPYLIIEELNKKYHTSSDIKVINLIINILNKYTWYDGDFNDIKDLLIYEFKNIYLKNKKIDEAIEVIKLEELNSDDIGIIVGFLVNTLPVTIKDEDYLTDKLLSILQLDTSVSKNKINCKLVVDTIDSHENLIITYSLSCKTGECYSSSLIDKLYGPNIIENAGGDKLFCDKYLKIKLGKSYDLYNKYGVISDNLKLLNNNYKIPYLQHNHKYKMIDKDKIKDYLLSNNGLTISYSDLDLYMKCSFGYYLQKLLKLSDYETNFKALIGSYFHKVLESIRKCDFNIEEVKQEFWDDKNLSNKELFLLDKLNLELLDTIKIIKKQESLSKYKDFYLEQRIELQKDSLVPITIKGFIDKIMVTKTKDQDYLALIDYKTGSYNNSLDNTIYGLDLQLPMYAYLVKNSELFKDAYISGFYIAPLLPKQEFITDGMDNSVIKMNGMKLVGFSTDKNNILELFDSTYKDSEVIKNMKYSDKGFGAYSKIISDLKMDRLISLVELKINYMIDSILSSSFSINPKYINENNMSCKYCKYSDICFHSYLDNVYLSKQKYSDFLGGEAWEETLH